MSERNKKSGTSTMALLAAAGVGALAGIFINSLFKEETPHSSGTSNMPERVIPLKPSQDCAICLLSLASPIEQLPCGHIFHQQCILTWIKQTQDGSFCPSCRKAINWEQANSYLKRESQ
ncbi:hypothetical protein RDWZM_001302 [Blomia tropicalis]|uniref:RING-type domain-containing protein n=1 Tax=Blomia tropicalis TaxID=40697 RepID=A0A9Q0MBY8_BLOTA|nr:hypothetical protein BLOT_007293 [Blomia tropicalis]KAJ6222757.1 hypothetical protein RDWZM_001302 [Blomia tropicalis]